MIGARPPGPRGLAVWRAVRAFQKSPLPALEQLTAEHGDAVCLSLPWSRTYVFAHPSLVHHVLLRGSQNYRKSEGTRAGRRFFGESMQLTNGERAKAMRRRLAPLFTADRLVTAYADLIVEETEACVGRWTPASHVNLTENLHDLLLQIMVRVHFGTKGEDTRRLGALYATAIDLLPDGVSGFIQRGKRKNYDEAVAQLDAAILSRAAEQRRNDRGENDFASEFLRLGVPEQQLRHELVSMMAASYRTVGMALVQTLRLLAETPSADAKVAEEAAVARARVPAMSSLPYTGRVVKESLRLCPPAGLMMRFATVDDTVGPWRVPAGSRVLVSSWLLQRDRRYFDQPLEFRPERWTTEFERALPACAYFPFGAGPRNCIGGILSDVTLRLILTTIARRFRLEAPIIPPERTAWPLFMADGGLRATLQVR